MTRLMPTGLGVFSLQEFFIISYFAYIYFVCALEKYIIMGFFDTKYMARIYDQTILLD